MATREGLVGTVPSNEHPSKIRLLDPVEFVFLIAVPEKFLKVVPINLTGPTGLVESPYQP